MPLSSLAPSAPLIPTQQATPGSTRPPLPDASTCTTLALDPSTGQMPDQTKRAPRVCSPVVTLPRWSLLLRARIQVHTRIIHALHQDWTALGSRCRHNRDVSSNSFAGDILVIPGSIALCRGPRRFVAEATRFTSFASGAAHAQPANPRTSLSTLGPCSCAASFMRRMSALRRLS